MKHFLAATILIAISIKVSCQNVHSTAAIHPVSADSVLQWLKKGNVEFTHGKFNVHGVDSSLRLAISKEQHPRAVILTCSDSRVPPELIFDKGLGDLFVIRVA